jgi:4-amino-4-deoxy-L-arabinose transferase-like glycosyltransferase
VKAETGAPRSSAVALLLPIVLLLFFVNKAYHIDDILFVWVTEQIEQAPLDFYGFKVDYGHHAPPIYEVFHNPPAVSYYLAVFAAIFGGGEAVYHGAMLLPIALTVLGMYLLARDLTPAPVSVTVLAALTPAFMLSASTLMADVPLLGFYVWAIYCWRRGITAPSAAWLAGAGVLAGMAALTKYYGLTLLPLLLADGLLRRRRPGAWIFVLLIPIAMTALFELWTYSLYGIVTLFDARAVAASGKWRIGEVSTTRWVLSLVFLGGCFAPLLLLHRWREARLIPAITAAFAALVCLPVLDGYSVVQMWIGSTERYTWDELITLGVMLWLGALLLIHAGRSLWRMRDADAALLALWIAGTMIFCAAFNHYVNARALLPLLPALAIAIGRAADARAAISWRAAAAGALALWLLIADYDVAEHDQRAAQRAVTRAKEDGKPLHYIAYWGLEYYLMKAGAHPLVFAPKATMAEPTRPLMAVGDLLVVDAYASAPWIPPPRGFEVVEEIIEPYSAATTTFDAHAAAGFYSHRIGVLPYRVGRVEPERFLLLRWRGK